MGEGCACFWRRSKFDLLFSERHVLSERLQVITTQSLSFRHLEFFLSQDSPNLSHILSRVRSNEALLESMLARTTALQLVALRCAGDPGRVLVVVNTHLYFRPDADHIRSYYYLRKKK